MKHISERQFILKYNHACGKVLGCERRKRNLTLEELSSGIMSTSKLEKVEKGTAQWTKLTGDTLLLRMGIPPEYFESLATGAELERWRLREDICLLLPQHPETAVEKIKYYRNSCLRREPLEEQFLMKAEFILMLCRKESPKTLLDTAIQAVECTIRKGWEQDINSLCLSPGELEAVLLVSAALFRSRRNAEGWRLWTAVWDYPKAHKWRERTMALILPQAAILGIRQVFSSCGTTAGNKAPKDSPYGKAARADMAARGRETLELLRRNCCHCYALPLLDSLCGIDAALFGEPGYGETILRFREMFREMYEWFDYPGYRIWQGISVDNTRDAGMTLKMLRTFYGKSRDNAVYDGSCLVVTPRQLEKIEKGIHKPSYENYRRLAKQYGKCGEWNMPLLETDSVDVLEQRQLICTLMEYNQWEQAEWEINRFRNMVNPVYSKVQQELLCFDASLKWKRKGALRESLDLMLDALRCTVPDFDGRDMKWWVFQREEIMIASNIGSLYYRLGNSESAKKCFEDLLFSIKQLCFRTGIYNCGIEIVALGYSNLLGTLQCFELARKISQEIAANSLLSYKINCFQYLLYHIAWNAYETADKKPEEYEFLRHKWKKAFQISESMSEFVLDTHLNTLLKERERKYLL